MYLANRPQLETKNLQIFPKLEKTEISQILNLRLVLFAKMRVSKIAEIEATKSTAYVHFIFGTFLNVKLIARHLFTDLAIQLLEPTSQNLRLRIQMANQYRSCFP